MLKKIIVIFAMFALGLLSLMLAKKTPNNRETSVPTVTNDTPTAQEETLPEEMFTINTQNMSDKCTLNNAMLCAVENAVKCTIKPEPATCSKQSLPKFIFMTDQSVDRPTEISFKFLNKKPLPNNTVEIYTESNCNGSWFGICEGTVIYVLAPNGDNAAAWKVNDIYAIE